MSPQTRNQPPAPFASSAGPSATPFAALALAMAAAVFAGGCGDDGGRASSCPGAGCPCVANDCDCADGFDCVWDSGGDDAFSCGTGGSCVASCVGPGCDVQCQRSARCEITAAMELDVSCVDVTDVCRVTTGRSADVECTSSVCELAVGDESDVSCDGDAACTVQCPARCSVACGEAATCLVECADDDAPVPVAAGSTRTCP